MRLIDSLQNFTDKAPAGIWHMSVKFKLINIILLYFGLAGQLHAENVRVAVASNFSATMKLLKRNFEAITGHSVIISSASTGKLFAQIVHGAPYDVFFSADSVRADLLVKKGLAEKSRVYAEGQLIYVARDIEQKNCRASLSMNSGGRLALANPKTAPYGFAAREVLLRLGLWDALRNKMVMGENILQTYQYIATGSANAGFLAKSTVLISTQLNNFCQWDVPRNLYQPIKQKSVLLYRSTNNVAVQKFLHYINSNMAKDIIKKNGYIVK